MRLLRYEIARIYMVMPDDRSRALQAGANDYVSKPVDLKYLVKLIERLIKEQ